MVKDQFSQSPGLSLKDLLLEETNLLALIVEKEGEIFPEIEEALKASQFDIENKTDKYALVIERLEWEAQFRAHKARREKEIQSRCEAVVERMKSCLKEAMLLTHKKELRGHETRFMLTGARSKIELRPEVSLSEVPSCFKRVEIKESLDKDKILARHESVLRGGSSDAALPVTDLFDITPCYALRKYPNTKSRKEIEEHE